MVDGVGYWQGRVDWLLPRRPFLEALLSSSAPRPARNFRAIACIPPSGATSNLARSSLSMLVDSDILSPSERCLFLFACALFGVPVLPNCPGGGSPRAAPS
eukprot:2734616-Pyramimonas_sp.AAC.1